MKRARITWLKVEAGGRIPPPSGTRYAPLIEIEGMKGMWSADFYCTDLINQNMLVDLGFLSGEAPIEILRKGCNFKLYEGKKLVAFGIVLN